MNKNQALEYLHGRLVGLAGTTRYDLPEELVNELKEIAAVINTQITEQTNDIPNF
jgi:hypothetical protein